MEWDNEQRLEAARKRDSRIVAIRPVALERLSEEQSADNGTHHYRMILLDESGVERCMTPPEWEAWLAEPTDTDNPATDDEEPEEKRPEAYSVNPSKIAAITPVASAVPILGTGEAVDEENDPMVVRFGYTDLNGVECTHKAKDIMEWSK